MDPHLGQRHGGNLEGMIPGAATFCSVMAVDTVAV